MSPLLAKITPAPGIIILGAYIGRPQPAKLPLTPPGDDRHRQREAKGEYDFC